MRPQTERECGVRVATYMLKIKEAILATKNGPSELIQNIQKKIEYEIGDKHDIAAKYRRELHDLLQRERENTIR